MPSVDKPLWQLGRRATVIAACVGFAALAACSVSVGTQSIEEASDIDVGECLQIGAEAGEGKVEATKAECEGTEGLTFYAADKVNTSAECGTPNTSALTFGEGDQIRGRLLVQLGQGDAAVGNDGVAVLLVGFLIDHALVAGRLAVLNLVALEGLSFGRGDVGVAHVGHGGAHGRTRAGEPARALLYPDCRPGP